MVDVENYPEAMKPYWITIRDIVALKPRQKVKFLCFDRNYDELYNQRKIPLKPGKLYTPQYFFRNNYIMEYTHDHDLSGYRVFKDMEGSDAFEFDIEYKPGHWYPLENGSLPTVDPQGLVNFGKNAGKHYMQFPPDTHVGWRGPMIRWSDLKYMPKVYFTEKCTPPAFTIPREIPKWT
jgi:hypothetical protein